MSLLKREKSYVRRLLAVPLSLPVPHRDRHEPGAARGHARGPSAGARKLPAVRRLLTAGQPTLIHDDDDDDRRFGKNKTQSAHKNKYKRHTQLLQV